MYAYLTIKIIIINVNKMDVIITSITKMDVKVSVTTCYNNLNIITSQWHKY